MVENLYVDKKVQEIGNSLAVLLPKSFSDVLNLKKGDVVSVELILGSGKITIEKKVV